MREKGVCKITGGSRKKESLPRSLGLIIMITTVAIQLTHEAGMKIT